VHCFYLKLINKVLYGQKHCLLPRENSQNQSQQVKARTAQKSSNLTDKLQAASRIFSDKNRESAVPANACILTNFVQQMPDFIRQLPDFDDLQQKRD
jgi:hypothetical protein